MARLGTRCLSAVSAYDNTLETLETLDAAQAKFEDILDSASVEMACEKIKSLAKAKELDSSLILLINSAWASAKESTTMKNEVMFTVVSLCILSSFLDQKLQKSNYQGECNLYSERKLLDLVLPALVFTLNSLWQIFIS